MKSFNKSIRLSVSLAALFFAQSSFAEVGITDPGGTRAGETISNTAVLSYSVNDVEQTDITSAAATFLVDKKVDLTVTGDSADNIKVTPLSTANTLTYVLSNDGNSLQTFKVDVSHLANELADSHFDAGTTAKVCEFTINDGTTTGAPISVGTAGTVELDIGEDATIVVSCSMPDVKSDTNTSGIEDGYLSTLDVLATAVDNATDKNTMAESSGADDIDAVDVVLADGKGTATDSAIRNAMHSATQTFEVDVPMLSVEKTSEVIWDPYNLKVNPKRIPGAIVEYTIKISNSSDAIASGVKITDKLDAVEDDEVKFVTEADTSKGMSPAASASGDTPTYDADSFTLIADGIAVPAAADGSSGEAVVTFQVEIK